MENPIKTISKIDGKEIFMYTLGAFTLGCAVSIIVLLIFFAVPVPNHDVIMLAVGIALGWATNVVSFFYGSSKSSSDKTDIIRNQQNPPTI